jgi:glycosyltransferase involved in cell wall biosynthesis
MEKAPLKAIRKRLLFLMPTLSGGGAERVIVTLLQHLDRSRFEPHLALIDAVGPLLKEVPADIPMHDLKAGRVRRAFPGILRLAWKLKPQVIHSAMVELNLATVLLRPFFPRGLRVLMREDTSPSALNAQGRKHPQIWNWLYRRLYPRADKVICVGDHVLDELADTFAVPRSKLVRIYNPVDLELARRRAEAGGNPYCGKGPHLVAAGRLAKEKGFDVLLDAMRMVGAASPNADLTILGEGTLKPDLLAQREALGLAGAVHVPGFQPNPYPYFKHADLFVLPSRWEGFGLVAIEALAVGTPVVATDCPGAVREILAGCPIARLVPPSDPQALARAIIAALKSAQSGFEPHQSLDSFLSRFDVKTVLREYEEILGT